VQAEKQTEPLTCSN